MATIEVRDARREDADAICDVHVAGWREGYKHVFPPELLWSESFESTRRERWRQWDDGDRLVAILDGRIVGISGFGPERARDAADQPQPPGRGEVYLFYLHPDVWGSGAAAALMAATERRLVERGFAEAILWVLEDNPRGRRFYEKAGWQPTGQRTAFDDYCAEQAPEVEYRRVLPS